MYKNHAVDWYENAGTPEGSHLTDLFSKFQPIKGVGAYSTKAMAQVFYAQVVKERQERPKCGRINNSWIPVPCAAPTVTVEPRKFLVAAQAAAVDGESQDPTKVARTAALESFLKASLESFCKNTLGVADEEICSLVISLELLRPKPPA